MEVSRKPASEGSWLAAAAASCRIRVHTGSTTPATGSWTSALTRTWFIAPSSAEPGSVAPNGYAARECQDGARCPGPLRREPPCQEGPEGVAKNVVAVARDHVAGLRHVDVVRIRREGQELAGRLGRHELA